MCRSSFIFPLTFSLHPLSLRFPFFYFILFSSLLLYVTIFHHCIILCIYLCIYLYIYLYIYLNIYLNIYYYSGRALLFLLPEETAFLKYLREAKVTLQEYEFPVNKVANIGTQTMMLVEKNYYLNKSARDAYRSYLLSYASHSHKDIFNVHELDLQGMLPRTFNFFVFVFVF